MIITPPAAIFLIIAIWAYFLHQMTEPMYTTGGRPLTPSVITFLAFLDFIVLFFSVIGGTIVIWSSVK